MKKALILTSHFLEQDSVASITKNIISSYKQLTHLKIKVLAIEDYYLAPLKITQYDYIIIVHPVVMLASELNLIIQTISSESTFIFYIFGDLIRKSGQLISLEKSLLGKKVHFISASICYQKVLRKCLNNKREITLIPFPLNQKTFFFSNTLRQKFRKKHNLSLKDKALIYTGRLSSQKNIDYLIQTFAKVKLKHPSLKLFIYGNVDEFEIPTFYENTYAPGNFFNQLKKTLATVSADDIYFYPRTSHQKLNEAYNGCDLFVSLSLYHDEDFGYSPLESLSSGTPAWLTSWGGFKDLKLNDQITNTIHYVKVEFEQDHLKINDTRAVKSLMEAIKNSKRSSSTSKKYQRHYSLEASSQRYKDILEKKTTPFTGFTEDFIKLSLSMYMNQNIDLNLYKNFYQSFWRS